jgi:two-component system response regulator DesR
MRYAHRVDAVRTGQAREFWRRIETVDDTAARTEPAPESVRVLIAEDVHALRQTLVALLTLEADIEVVAELAAGDGIVPAAIRHRPDVALLDIDLPVVDGLTATAELRRLLPSCRTAILTGLSQPDILRQALAAGAFGFLLKDLPADDLIAAIRAVAHGELVIDPRLAPPSH